MSTYFHKPGFETLKASESGRRVVSAAGRYEVQAKVLKVGDGAEFLILRTWMGSRPQSPTEDWSEPSLWSHIVLDEDQNLIAQGFGRRERDSWSMTERLLRAKGVLDAVTHTGRSSRFVWQPGDVDFLTKEQAEAAIEKPLDDESPISEEEN